jgi:hypothetical protein
MLLSTLAGRHVITARRTPNGSVFTRGHRILEIGPAYARTVDPLRDGAKRPGVA